jgi:Helix-turn-helix domain
MPVTQKKTVKKAASAAKKRNVKATPARKQTPKKRVGVTSAVAKRSAKRFGDPTDRLRERLKEEAKRGDVTPLDPNDKLLRLREAADRLRISRHTLREWALRDKVIYRRVGGLLLMIPESEVTRLLSYGN